MSDERLSLVRVGIAACVACCAVPILVLVLGVGVAGVVGAVLAGAAGLAVAGVAGLGVMWVRRRHQACPPEPETARRLIPLHDESAPIACTITDEEVPGRVALLERLRAHVTELEATEHGVVLHFPARAEVEADVRRFAADEKRCCEFWGFDVAADDREVTLRWDAPPGARDLLDQIEAYLAGDEPISSLSGLL